MGGTSKDSIQPPPSGKIPNETPLPFTSPTYSHLQTLNPATRLSLRNNGSSLYDSYELQAVTYQLNKAMRQPSGSSPAYLCYLKSPFYSQCVNRENSRKVLCSHLTCATININARNRRTKEVTRGFAAKLWNKVKQRLLRSNNMQTKELRGA
ncbi:hypothetical protein J1N35_026932 [Gossypium stocksii]|uniref:Uncharacterized protein n=1 Tax=Gossypium stocksii TaxID=47602 RepID=A0A9D3V9D7_9ROSI|nr:hypothetical protein J1N35_026932 [Gossypium stocksii]